MSRASVRKETLCRARDLLGGPSALVRAFSVRASDLDQWLHGKADVPAWVFLRAVDLVNDKEQGGGGGTPGQ